MTDKPWAILCSKEGLSHIYGHYARRSDAELAHEFLRRRLPNFTLTVFWNGEVSA